VIGSSFVNTRILAISGLVGFIGSIRNVLWAIEVDLKTTNKRVPPVILIYQKPDQESSLLFPFPLPVPFLVSCFW
jgi:hypothetical protein